MENLKANFVKIFLSNPFLSALSGLLLAMAFPRFNWGFLAWFALLPLFLTLFSSRPKSGLLCGFIAGVIFFLTTAYWMFIFGRLAGLSFAIFQSLFFAAFGAGAVIIHRYYGWQIRPPLIASLWVALELLRSLGPFGVSFGTLGYSQHNFAQALATASFLGAHGLSFLIALTNQAFAEIAHACISEKDKGLKRRITRVLPLAIFPILIVLALSLVKYSEVEPNQREVKVAVLQPNIPQEVKWQPMSQETIFDVHLDLAKEAAKKKPDIIIWPETALPAILLDEEEYLAEIKKLAKESGSYMLVGGLYEQKDDSGSSKEAASNSAFLFAPNGEITGRYDKLRPVPFGEYIPLRPVFSKIKALETIAYDAKAGSDLTIFETPFGRFSTVICFESTDPFLVRSFAKKGAEAIIVMTNDGWFKETAAAEQHMTMAKFRAAENGLFVVQAANTGISAIIDSGGQVVGQTGLNEEAILKGDIKLGPSQTTYGRFGHLLPWILLTISATSILLTLIKKPLQKP